MQIDWHKTIEEILADKMTCPRCGSLTAEIAAGYTREPWGADYAPRCQACSRKDDCDARKLVFLCTSCARDMHVRARRVDEESMMVMLLNDCRRDLEECLDYVAEFWQEDLNVPPEHEGKRLEEFDQEAFAEEDEARRRLEEEYTTYHRWFREHGLRIPNPSWRAEYVEEVIGLGYSTLLGD
jgi:predicted RNA-binding Zn-ribbon protein involved in translation (DUF1610 family)